MTPSQAKNAISKALLEILDPRRSKTQDRHIRAYFGNKCAYCGVNIPPEGRTGHFDHLISRQNGGTNHISNLVLSCNICNGDEKLDQDWRVYIHQKVTDISERQLRIAAIDKWISDNTGPIILSPEMAACVQRARLKVNLAFDQAISELREIKASIGGHRYEQEK